MLHVEQCMGVYSRLRLQRGGLKNTMLIYVAGELHVTDPLHDLQEDEFLNKYMNYTEFK